MRYADDFVLGSQRLYDAKRSLVHLRERLAKFRLELHLDKTRLPQFGRFAARPAQGEGQIRRTADLQLPRADALLQQLAEWVVPVTASYDAFAVDGEDP